MAEDKEEKKPGKEEAKAAETSAEVGSEKAAAEVPGGTQPPAEAAEKKKLAPKKDKAGDKEVFRGTGRRKCSVARLYLVQGGGSIKINRRELNEYFPREMWRRHVLEPLVLTEKKGTVDLMINVHGGGMTGQAGAIRHALARALVKWDESTRKILRKSGCLTRDPRMVERKKYGQPGARKRFQYSKR